MGKLAKKINSFIYDMIKNLFSRMHEFEMALLNLNLEKQKRNLEAKKIKAEIRDLKSQYNPIYKKLSKFVTHKLLMYLIFINCTVIEIFSMRVMIMFADLSALPTLMVSVITESISYAIYCAKSYSGTKQEKIQELDEKKFELEKEIAMYELENGSLDNTINGNDGSVG